MSRITEEFKKICLNNNQTAFYYIENKRLKSKTFQKVYEEVNAIANNLLELGVKKGDRIFALAPSNYRLCLFIMGAFKIGASLMYIDLFAKQDKVNNLFNKYKPQYILVSNKTRYIKPFIKNVNRIKKVINIDKIDIKKVKEFDLQIDESNYALLTTTTGQTGEPKIFIRTHEDLYNQLEVIMNNIDKKNCNTILTTSYIYVFANLLLGKTTVIPNIDLKKKPDTINKKLSVYNNIAIDTFITSPDFLLKADNNFKNLKTIYFGGAILNINEATKIYNKFRNCHINYIYGSTECNIISINTLTNYINCLKEKHLNNLGHVIKEVKIKTNEEQDIIVTGKNLLTKSIEGENSTNEYNTNDKGYLLEDELIYLGRKNFKVQINKKNKYYNQIEQEIILETPEIEKCAFLEENNKYYLFITNKSIDLNRIETTLKNKYNIEAKIIILKEIPCDIKHHTKIDYRKLRRMI